MQVELDRKGLIDLVKSSVPSMDFCIKYTEEKKMYFCGNQHNENWCWNQDYLDKLPDALLFNLYLNARDSRISS